MNSSPERGTFHRQCAIERAIEDGQDPDTSESVQNALEIELMFKDRQAEQYADPEWRKNNLEYDLRSNKWICDKAKASEVYAQNLYAAMCNNDFQKLDVWPLLKGETYSCSWRYAGGIVADMIESGDYIDWYCSGITNCASEDELDDVTDDESPLLFNFGFLICFLHFQYNQDFRNFQLLLNNLTNGRSLILI